MPPASHVGYHPLGEYGGSHAEDHSGRDAVGAAFSRLSSQAEGRGNSDSYQRHGGDCFSEPGSTCCSADAGRFLDRQCANLECAARQFPFFGWPANYAPQNTPKEVGFGHFPFWTGKAFNDIEGQTFMVTLDAAPNKQFSSYELQKNMQTLFQQAGAVKVFEGKIPYDTLKALPDTVRSEISPGLGDAYNDPVETWVIHRPHDAIWINYSTNTAQGAFAVVQTKPFVPTAVLLPADQLKTALDQIGKAVIHVNFATDQTQLLPTSGPQMDAVIALLKGDPSLKLAINGYTDDTGSDDHNVTLSDGRAKAVQAALVAAGIKSDRLQAKGYGRMIPVSNNTDEAGKAANRRVELVKL
ncbi:OmpA family protein [Sphingomonas sp. PAMC 26621]|uniref:OmpA family protein n=1 Tax=Sphingomonas sp. PAMC 26621 TaxID=1112213 RepID=UPI001478588A|nr:OmpA family protein [Sphingomonas sp. PAMC 26621]